MCSSDLSPSTTTSRLPATTGLDTSVYQPTNPYYGGATPNYNTIGSSGSSYDSSLARDLYQEREDALAKQEDLYNSAKAAIDAAYTSGLMNDSEYNNLLTSTRETIEAQYADLMERTSAAMNTGYGPSGAAQSAIGKVETGRIGAVAGGYRDIAVQRALRSSEAAQNKATGYQILMQLYDIPYPEIPEGMSRDEVGTALTGAGGSSGTTYYNPGFTPLPTNYYTPDTSIPSSDWSTGPYGERISASPSGNGGAILMPSDSYRLPATPITKTPDATIGNPDEWYNDITGERKISKTQPEGEGWARLYV